MHEMIKGAEEGESIPSWEGGMGHYRLDYHLGTHAFIAAHKNLMEQGYRLLRQQTGKLKTTAYTSMLSIHLYGST